MRRELPMRLLNFGAILIAAGTLAACNKTDDVSASPQHGGGRFYGIGIYPVDELWSQQTGTKSSADAAKATLSDDAQIIVVVDSRTGEVRQCGNQSGHCTSLNPWAGHPSSSQVAPVSLTKHAADLQREATEVGKPTESSPTKGK